MYFVEQGCICLKAVFAGCCQDAVIWLENWVTLPPSKQKPPSKILQDAVIWLENWVTIHPSKQKPYDAFEA